MSVEEVGAEPTGLIVEPSGEVNVPDLSDVTAHEDMGDTVRAVFRKLGSPGDEGRAPIHRPREELKPNTKVPEKDPLTGKFKAKVDKAGIAVPEVPKEPATETDNSTAADDQTGDEAVATTTPEVTEEKPLPDSEKAPTSWKGGAQAKFAALDPEVKAEIHKREADFHKGLEGYKQYANIGKMLHAEIEPHAAMIKAANLTPQQVIKDLFATASQLRGGTQAQKIQVVRNIAREYNIDLNAVVPTEEELAAEAARPAPDPEVPLLREKLTAAESRAQELHDQQINALKSEAEAFAKSPGHEHFEEVKAMMATLLHDGQAKTLQEAYDNAIYAVPAVRAKVTAKQQETQRKQAADKAAAAKKAASTNVTTRGSLQKGTTPVKGTDMADTVRNVLRNIQSRPS